MLLISAGDASGAGGDADVLDGELWWLSAVTIIGVVAGVAGLVLTLQSRSSRRSLSHGMRRSSIAATIVSITALVAMTPLVALLSLLLFAFLFLDLVCDGSGLYC